MKKQVSPAIVVIIVVLTFAIVLTSYWKGLLGKKEGDAQGPMGGGGGMPPPPIVGLATVTVSTIAGPLPGTPQAGEGGLKDGKLAAVRFDGPSALAAASDGTLYVTDSRNHRIRAIAPDGAVTTIAGSGPVASVLGAFADGPADAARFWNPSGIAATPDGALYIADTGNHRIRELVGSRVTTIAGGDTPKDRLDLPDGAFADGPGRKARFRYPTGIIAMPDGALLVADTGNRRLRRIAPDGTVTTIADLGAVGAVSPCGLALLPDGRILVADPGAEAVYQVAPDGQVVALPGINKDAPIWIGPTGIAADAAGTVYIADAGSHCVMRLAIGGAPAILAGTVPIDMPCPGYSNGTGEQAAFGAPCAIVIGRGGELYVTDFGNNCVRVVRLQASGIRRQAAGGRRQASVTTNGRRQASRVRAQGRSLIPNP